MDQELVVGLRGRLLEGVQKVRPVPKGGAPLFPSKIDADDTGAPFKYAPDEPVWVVAELFCGPMHAFLGGGGNAEFGPSITEHDRYCGGGDARKLRDVLSSRATGIDGWIAQRIP